MVAASTVPLKASSPLFSIIKCSLFGVYSQTKKEKQALIGRFSLNFIWPASIVLFQVLHRLVDGICHRSRPIFEDYSKIWSLQEWWGVSETCTDLMKEAVKDTWSKDQVSVLI